MTAKLLILILFLGSLLRLFQISSNPPGLDWDEASLGWNAYTISQTGRDEYGVKFPVSLRSFNDYKPSLYVYSSVPFISLLGRTELAVRLPSALAGIAAIVGIYLFVIELTKKRRLALLSALLLAVCPWHLQFSRVAFEANLALTFFIFGVYGLMVFIRSKKLLPLLFSIATFSGAMYAYHSPRLVIPLFLGLVVLIYRRRIFPSKKIIILTVLAVVILMFPLAHSTITTGSLQARLTEVIAPINQGVTNYINHFSPNFLFVNGDNNIRHHAPNTGLLLWWSLPFLLLGLKFLTKKYLILLAWVISAPIASAITIDSPHAVRALLLLPPLVIITAFGLDLFSKKRIVSLIFSLLFVFNLGYFFYNYFVTMPIVSAQGWQYGYKQLVETNYKNIYVTTAYDQPYIYFLYYGKYPANYFNPGDFSRGFGPYTFGLDKNIPSGSLIVSAPSDKMQPKKLVKQIFFPDGKVAFSIGIL